MLPTINGKEIIDCNLDDLRTIINNPDYAENEYLDYKRCFAIDVVEKEKRHRSRRNFVVMYVPLRIRMADICLSE